MNNKEIIIDGVDVSRCMCYKLKKCLFQVKGHNSDVAPNCEGLYSCDFKKLQRALKENDLLKHKIIGCNKRMNDMILLLQHGIQCNND